MAETKKVFIGSFLLIGQSLSTKVIGLVSTLILARVLVPDDFGLVAIATLLFGFVQVLSTTGSMQYLLSIEDIDDLKINTSWTLDFLFKLPLSLLFALSAPYIAGWYGDERLIDIIYVFALLLLVSCVATPAESLLRREQNFTPMVKLGVFSKIFSVFVAVSIALIFESYWALVFGQVANGLIQCVGSYIIHDYRPRFTLKKLKEQWIFSSWMLPQAVVGFFRSQLDTLIVSAYFNKSILGSYHVMKYLAYIPSAHIILPATQPLLVELRKVKNDSVAFTNQFNISFIATMLIVIPMCSMLMIHHNLVTLVLLGDQWGSFSILLSAFSLIILAMALFQQCQRVLIIDGRTKYIFFYEIVSFSVLYSSLLVIGAKNILEFSVVRVGIELLSSIILFSYITVTYTSKSNLYHLCVIIFPIFLSSFLSILVSKAVDSVTDFNFLNLVIASVTFLSVFSSLMAVFYLLGIAKSIEYEYLRRIASRGFTSVINRIRK